MKQIRTFFLLLAGLLAFSISNAQSAKTENIKVWGNCGMCKKTIEKAAKIEGVKKATWDEETGVLAVQYKPSKASTDKIQQAIAAAGYDTEKYTANKTAYDNLPGCCQYDRKKKEDSDHSNHQH